MLCLISLAGLWIVRRAVHCFRSFPDPWSVAILFHGMIHFPTGIELRFRTQFGREALRGFCFPPIFFRSRGAMLLSTAKPGAE
jgi:hypothetical protein